MKSDPPVVTQKPPFSVARILALLAVLAIFPGLYLADKHEDLVKTCNLNPGEPKDTLAACDTLLTWTAWSPETRSLMHRHKMRVFIKQEDWDAAAREVDLAIAEDPQSPVPWQWKSLILARVENYPAAMEAVDTALNLSSGTDYSLESKAKPLRRTRSFAAIEALVEDAIANHSGESWVWNYAGSFWLKAEDYQSSAQAFSKALKLDLRSSYSRRKFFEACIGAGSDCPPLFPERRNDYPRLSCKDAILKWGEHYPDFRQQILQDTGLETLEEFFDDDNWAVKTIVQAVYLGPAMSTMQRYSSDDAARLIVDGRVFDCVNGGQFTFPKGYAEEEQELANEKLFSPELRANLVDLAHATQN